MKTRKSFGKEVEQRVRGLARLAAGEVPGVVLDPRAVAGLADHLEVVVDPALEPLGLDDLLLGAASSATRTSRSFSISRRIPRSRSSTVRKWVAGKIASSVELPPLLLGRPGRARRSRSSGPPVEDDPVDGLARAHDVDRAAADPEAAALQLDVVAGVLHPDRAAREAPAGRSPGRPGARPRRRDSPRGSRGRRCSSPTRR